MSVPTDISFLVAHFKELTEETQTYLIWASLFGPTYVHFINAINPVILIYSFLGIIRPDSNSINLQLQD